MNVETTAAINLSLALIPIVYGSIEGTVIDSMSGKPVAGALLVYSEFDGTQTKTATTGSNGTFKIDSVTTGDLIVTNIDYLLKVVHLTFLNSSPKELGVALIGGTRVIGGGTVATMKPAVSVTPWKSLLMSNFLGTGAVRLYDACGRCIYATDFSTLAAHRELPLYGIVAGGHYIIRIMQKNSLFQDRIIVP